MKTRGALIFDEDLINISLDLAIIRLHSVPDRYAVHHIKYYNTTVGLPPTLKWGKVAL